MGKKTFIMDGNSIRNCASNISKMNIFEFMWYYCQIDEYHPKKPNIGWFLLFLFIPYYNGIMEIFKKPKELLDITVSEFFMLIFYLLLIISGLGPILAITIAYIKIKLNKKRMKSF